MWEMDLDTHNVFWGLSNVRRCKLSAIWTEKEHGTEKVEHSLSASARGSHYTAPPTSSPIILLL